MYYYFASVELDNFDFVLYLDKPIDCSWESELDEIWRKNIWHTEW